jgi:hypothetical protein
MSHFTVRVELHDTQPADYNTLHAAMVERGFSRLITSDEGRTYELPWAEYDRFGKFTTMQVLGIAQTAAASTSKKNSVLVTEVKSRAWSGLPIATVKSDVVPGFEECLPATVDRASRADDWA